MIISDLLYYCEMYKNYQYKIEISVNKHDFEKILPQARKLGYRLISNNKILKLNKQIKIYNNIVVIDDYNGSNDFIKLYCIYGKDFGNISETLIIQVLSENERIIKALLE